MKINPGRKKNRFFMRASGSEFVPGVKKNWYETARRLIHKQASKR